MNRDETTALLKARSGLTAERYGDDTIDAWHDALQAWTYDECRTALIRAARNDKRITVAHIVERLTPRARPIEPEPEHEPGCTHGTDIPCELHRERAQRWTAIIRAEMAERAKRHTHPTDCTCITCALARHPAGAIGEDDWP